VFHLVKKFTIKSVTNLCLISSRVLAILRIWYGWNYLFKLFLLVLQTWF